VAAVPQHEQHGAAPGLNDGELTEKQKRFITANNLTDLNASAAALRPAASGETSGGNS